MRDLLLAIQVTFSLLSHMILDKLQKLKKNLVKIVVLLLLDETS